MKPDYWFAFVVGLDTLIFCVDVWLIGKANLWFWIRYLFEHVSSYYRFWIVAGTWFSFLVIGACIYMAGVIKQIKSFRAALKG